VARAKVIDFDYYQFIGLLRRATDAGARIEKGDARWAQYVKEHQINEVAASSIKDTDGLYFYSKNEEACMRLVPLAE
jgi:hypothetical protein